MDSQPSKLDRRSFVRLAATGMMAMPALLAACGGAATPASPASSPASAVAKPASVSAAASPSAAASVAASAGASASAAAKPSAGASGSAAANPALPTYIPLASKPKPDYVSKGELYEDGYIAYPKNAPKSVTTTPGSGGTVALFDDGLYPLATPVDQNPAWQAINKALGATIQFNKVPPADYNAKLAAIMAGGDLPDVVSLFGGLGAAPNLPQFLQQAASDLTPFLGGDKAKDYPNLANIPTFAWKNVGGVLGGKLWMVPIERPIISNMLLRNVNIWDKVLGQDYTPKNSDDFKKALQAVNDPSKNQWAIGAFQGPGTDSRAPAPVYMMTMFASFFGSPNNWSLDSASGKLTKDWETPQFKEAVGYVRDIVAAGLYYPDSVNTTSAPQGMTNFMNGKHVLAMRTLGLDWADGWAQGQGKTPPLVSMPIKPWAAHDGQKPVFFLGTGYAAGTMIKKASPDRVQELLRILNWTASPFGTQEYLLMNYGIEGTHYQFDANGNPVTTDKNKWMNDVYNLDWRYMASAPQVMYNANYPDYAKAEYDAETALTPSGILDPTLGFYSATALSKGLTLNKTFSDGLTGIISGQRPLTDYDGIVKDWVSAGGDTIRNEYQQAIAASK
jgi:putative aldouronate transport system substrate-binding protein